MFIEYILLEKVTGLKEKSYFRGHKAFIKRYRYKSKIFIALVFVIFLLNKLSVFNCLGFIGSDEAKLIIKDFEKYYLYNEVFQNKKYIEIKNKLLEKRFATKSGIYDLIIEAKELADDNLTELRYVNFFQGRFTHLFNKKVNISRKRPKKNIVYIKLNNFGENAAYKFAKTLEKEKITDCLVLDLRGNNMGSYIEAIQIADDLLPEGSVIAQIECSSSKHLYCSNPFYYSFNTIYVLVDKESGYCTEIVALALKENLKEKVIIVGNKTMAMEVGSILKEYNNKIGISIAHFNWHIEGKSAADLGDYVLNYNDIEFKTSKDGISLKEIIKFAE